MRLQGGLPAGPEEPGHGPASWHPPLGWAWGEDGKSGASVAWIIWLSEAAPLKLSHLRCGLVWWERGGIVLAFICNWQNR